MRTNTIEELRIKLQDSLVRGTINQSTIDAQTERFRQNFGPDALRGVDNEALLRLMHGRRENEPRCMAYWLEYKNDEEFSFNLFGGVGGGNAMKFGLFERPAENLWLTRQGLTHRALSVAEAIAQARVQRDELVAGCEVLSKFNPARASDEACIQLDSDMRDAAPTLATSSWAHKYWFLVHPDHLEPFHSPERQRFHLLKLLQLPPDGAGVVSRGSPSRFVCAARFLDLARTLDTSMTILGKLLGELHRGHDYWKVGTTVGNDGGSQWPTMKDQGIVSIGWKECLGDMTAELKAKDLKERVAERIRSSYDSRGMVTRKAGEIVNLLRNMQPNDIVLACEGATVRGVGRITGPYEFRPELDFPHTRQVEWLSLEEWKMDPLEGPHTSVFPFGVHANNVLAAEKRLADVVEGALPVAAVPARTGVRMRPLDPWKSRVESALKRKGQVILYGPPGTGKTWRALDLVKELAARHAFRKSVDQLSAEELASLSGKEGLVRVCTFHPNWGYEDFVEGIRPQASEGVISFEHRDGIFKTLCKDASKAPAKDFYLIIDEINRGDLPRILGELMTVMELDKRNQSITLPVSAEPFQIPRNVFMVGTMNTADRSISLLDAAVRRRFAFVELMPDTSLLAGQHVRGLPLGPWLGALNARVRKHLKRDARNLQIGHAYLMPDAGITSFGEFARVLRDEIVPLLEEYCYDDFHTLREILGKDLVDVDNGRIVEELFLAEREDDLLQAVCYEEVGSIALTEEAPLADEDSMAEGDDVGADTADET